MDTRAVFVKKVHDNDGLRFVPACPNLNSHVVVCIELFYAMLTAYNTQGPYQTHDFVDPAQERIPEMECYFISSD
jgi:hypothetical protein